MYRAGKRIYCILLHLLLFSPFCRRLQGGNTEPRVQAVSENCKDVQILCQHTYSLYKGIETQLPPYRSMQFLYLPQYTN